jgi:transcriptional regulator GlxA family with amidase domain
MRTPIVVSVLLVPGFMLSAYALFTDALRLANWRSGIDLYRWSAHSPDDQDVMANDGTQLRPTAPLDGATPDAAFIAAGFSPELGCTSRVMRWLRSLDRAGRTLGGWDTGALILAKAGTMSNRRMAVHWQASPALDMQFPDNDVRTDIVVAEKRRFTAPGGISTFDLAIRFISVTSSPAVAMAVEKSANRHIGSVSAPFSPTQPLLPPGVARAVGIMEENVERPLTIPELSKRANVSQRSLSRAFVATLGTAPARYYLDLRLARAHDLLRQSDLSILDVATMAGFVSASRFSQAFRIRFGLSPREVRKHTTWLALRDVEARNPMIRTTSDDLSRLR